jgi:hypothetical protein
MTTTSDDGVIISDPKQSKEDQTQQRLEELLSEVESGWKISVVREQPSWCRGHLETFEILDPSEKGGTIDVDYLIRMWGGHRLHLRIHNQRGRWLGGGSISLFSYPPKVRGQVLKESDYFGGLAGTDRQPAPQQPAGFYPGQPQAAQPAMDIGKLLELLGKNQKTDMGTLLRVLEFVRPQAQATQAAMPQNPLEQMMQMMSLFKEMKGFLGEFAGTEQSGESADPMTGMFGELIKGMFAGRQQPARTALVPPAKGRPPLTINQHQAPPVPSSPEPAPPLPQTTGGDTLQGMANALAGMSAQDAADVVMLALGNMPEAKRQQAMAGFVENWEDAQRDDQDELDNIDKSDNINRDDPISTHDYPGKDSRR